jgi:adenine-specific DNA-methyltransferase
MTFKRRVLSAFAKAALLEIGRGLELEVKASMSVDELRDVLASSKRAKLDRIVTEALSRDTLKAICETCGLDTTGKEKKGLVDRILAAGGGAPVGDDDAQPVQGGLALPEVAPEIQATARASITKVPRGPRAKAAAAEASDGIVSYRHSQTRKANPEVGLVDPDTDPLQPRTTWAYDPHLDPTLQFDVGRAQIENLIDSAITSGDEVTMRKALEQLRRQAEPYLAWTGKAERTTFEVDTVSLHVHERVDPASILAAVRKGAAKATAADPRARRESHHQWVRIFCGGRNPIDSADLIVQDLSGHPEGG